MTSVPDIMLNNGKTIPQFGFGVFQIEPENTAQAVTTALDAGYRHLDTAEMYGNEKETGQGVAEYDIDRADVFITSKLNNGFHRPDDARKAFDETLAKLGTDYIDLFLIHWPLPTRYDGDYVSTWQTLEEFYREGRARSIGVSNFQPHHLRRLHEECEITPAINQIEVHPYLTQDDVRSFCGEHQIAIEAWSPIAQGRSSWTTRRSARSPSASARRRPRWCCAGTSSVRTSSSRSPPRPSASSENIDIFDFELSGADVAAISALNKNERTGPDPDTFDMIPS